MKKWGSTDKGPRPALLCLIYAHLFVCSLLLKKSQHFLYFVLTSFLVCAILYTYHRRPFLLMFIGYVLLFLFLFAAGQQLRRISLCVKESHHRGSIFLFFIKSGTTRKESRIAPLIVPNQGTNWYQIRDQIR